jgi:hypothetical protein
MIFCRWDITLLLFDALRWDKTSIITLSWFVKLSMLSEISFGSFSAVMSGGAIGACSTRPSDASGFALSYLMKLLNFSRFSGCLKKF